MNCIYHKSDFDGQCSAAIVGHKFYEQVAFLPMDYNDIKDFEPESLGSGSIIYMVDFSLSPEKMNILYDKHTEFHWIDHHISAIKDINLTIPGKRDITKAACELTWEYLFPETQLPKVVEFLGIYDSWRHNNDPKILAFQLGLRNYDTNPQNSTIWSSLFAATEKSKIFKEIISQGEVIQKYIDRHHENLIKYQSYPTTFQSLSCLVINTTEKGSLLFGDRIHEFDLCISYSRSKDLSWNYNLYSNKPDISCADIAKSYGGGGHKGAAGFILKELII